MVENGEDKVDKFDFSSAGEAPGYISLEQARLLAMQTAREEPGDYSRRFAGIRMVFQPVQQEEGEDFYEVTLSFRPEGDFDGKPGEEQFFIEKEGRVAHRQALSYPRGGGGRRIPIIPVGIGLALVAIVAVVAVLFVGGGNNGGKNEQANVGPDPTQISRRTATPATQRETTPTPTPVSQPPRPVETPPGPTSTPGRPTPTALQAAQPGPTRTPGPAAPLEPTPTTVRLIPTNTPNSQPVPAPNSGPLNLVLTQTTDHPQGISADAGAGSGASRSLLVPMIFGLPEANYYDQLQPKLWSPSSLIFTGSGLSGSWPGNPTTFISLQLEGLKDADYYYCVGVRRNGTSVGNVCGSGISNAGIKDGALQMTSSFGAPNGLNSRDVLEISMIFGSSLGPGGKPVPHLVYGGRSQLTTSTVKIIPDLSIAGKGTCQFTNAGAAATAPSKDLRMFLIPSGGTIHTLSTVNKGGGDGISLDFPVGSTLERVPGLGDLRPKLWTPSSVIFCGSGFSASLPGKSDVRVNLRLKGNPSTNLPYCVELRKNGQMLANSCSIRLSILSGEGPVRDATLNLSTHSTRTDISSKDVIELSISISTGGGAGTPTLYFGGSTALSTGFVEITPGDT